MLFLESLKVMGLGMLGIFTVTVALVLIMKLLTKLFPARNKGSGNQNSQDWIPLKLRKISKLMRIYKKYLVSFQSRLTWFSIGAIVGTVQQKL